MTAARRVEFHPMEIAMTKIIASAFILVSALTLGAPAYAQHTANTAAIAASNSSQASFERLWDQKIESTAR